MSNKAIYKSGFDFRHVIIIMTLLLPGLFGYVNDYILFFLIYTSILYFFSSMRLKRVDLFIDHFLIKYPFCFWKKDKTINYSNVIEFKHYSIPRGQDLFKVKYKDIDDKIIIISFPCERAKANIVMEEIKKTNSNITFTIQDSWLHSMK